jgi:hypothetical protein
VLDLVLLLMWWLLQPKLGRALNFLLGAPLGRRVRLSYTLQKHPQACFIERRSLKVG